MSCAQRSSVAVTSWWRQSPTAPAAGQVLARTLACGICGSHLHAAKHMAQFVDLSRRTGNRWAMDPSRDVVFGHEFCCEVLEHGPGTEKALKPGTPVCSFPMTLVGNAVHGIGYSNDIAGGFAQYLPLAERPLLPVANGLPATHAALTDVAPLITGQVGLGGVRDAFGALANRRSTPRYW